MGRFRIYAHNEIPNEIIEKIESDRFITSTSVTLSPSRHIFWEVMFAGFSSTLFYRKNSNIIEKILCTNLTEALDCLSKFAAVKSNPFIIPRLMSKIDMQYMITQFVEHLHERLVKGFILYNITEVFETYNVAKTEDELINAICASKDFYTKILFGQPVTYREMLYGLSGTLFENRRENGSLIDYVIENPTSQEVYNSLAGVEDM